MKYWGRSLIVYLTITAVLYGTVEVLPRAWYDAQTGEQARTLSGYAPGRSYGSTLTPEAFPVTAGAN